MQLLLLGTAGYHPSDTRQTACLFLPEHGIALDAGTGFYRVRDHLRTPELNIFLTHAHLDHVVGLTFWFDIVHQRRIDRATVHGQAEKLQAIRQNLLSEHLFPAELSYEYRPLTPIVGLPSGGKLTHFPLTHPGGSIGYRLDWPGHSMAYVTDTNAAPDALYVDAIRGVDLLVHECNFRDDECEFAELTGHSCTSAVAQLAKNAGVKRLVLTHINPIADERDPVEIANARAIFSNVEVGYDKLSLDF